MDNIIIAQEIVHSMKRKKGSTGWMVMKLDLGESLRPLTLGLY